MYLLCLPKLVLQQLDRTKVQRLSTSSYVLSVVGDAVLSLKRCRRANGKKTWTKGPMVAAKTRVPTPMSPPSNQPPTRTVISMELLTSRIDLPRAAIAVIKPSRGPGPKSVETYSDVAAATNRIPTPK